MRCDERSYEPQYCALILRLDELTSICRIEVGAQAYCEADGKHNSLPPQNRDSALSPHHHQNCEPRPPIKGSHIPLCLIRPPLNHNGPRNAGKITGMAVLGLQRSGNFEPSSLESPIHQSTHRGYEGGVAHYPQSILSEPVPLSPLRLPSILFAL
jgi:hypothetical protein